MQGRDPSVGQGDIVCLWRELYRQLLQISRSQRDLLIGHAREDGFLERFEHLAKAWKEKQEQIQKAEEQLRSIFGEERLRDMFTADILPFVKEMESFIGEAAEAINRQMENAGASLRAMRERRQIRNAYADPEPHGQVSIFFDEKS